MVTHNDSIHANFGFVTWIYVTFWNTAAVPSASLLVRDADEFQQAAHCLQSLLEFSQSQQGSAFPGFQQQCLDQKSALQEVSTLPTTTACDTMLLPGFILHA